MWMKIVMVLFLVAIIYCLGSAAYYMMLEGASTAMAKALTWRVALSLLLVVLLIAGYYLGWVTPHPL